MKKPKLSFWQIWNMSFGFFGIQFGFALQNANVSRIFETLGADLKAIPILWIAAPLTGLIVQPIIGYFSDRTWCSMGRRRPYFLVGAICASVALLIMPNSPVLWVAAGMLWIMDAAINVSMEPFRAFVGDQLPADQRTKGFAMQSFFIGAGSVIASALPYILTNWFGVSNIAPEGVIPDSVKWSFYSGAVVFLLAVLWTVVKSREYSPSELAAFNKEQKISGEAGSFDYENSEAIPNRASVLSESNHGPILLIIGLILCAVVYFLGWEKELYIVTGGVSSFGLLLLVATFISKKGRTSNGLVVTMNDFYAMPRTMKQLAVVQFFSWFALFSMWIYATAGVTSHLYEMTLSESEVSALEKAASNYEHINLVGDSSGIYEDVVRDLAGYRDDLASGNDEVVSSMRTVNFFITHGTKLGLEADMRERMLFIQKEYNTGADWVGIAFAAYNGFAALVAFALPVFSRWSSRKTTHALALMIGSIGLASVYFLPGPNWLILSMLGVGIAWASILSMPYAILSGALPSDKMGLYMGIFNFFIVLPQMLAASVLGFFVQRLFGGQAVLALVLGGVAWVIAAILTLFVEDIDAP